MVYLRHFTHSCHIIKIKLRSEVKKNVVIVVHES